MEEQDLIKKLFYSMDSDTAEHCRCTKVTANYIAKDLGLNVDLISNAALLHDIGNNIIQQSVLSKKGKLTKTEREAIDILPYFGYQILKEAGVSEDICLITLYHHGFNKPFINGKKPDCPNRLVPYVETLRTIDVFEALTSPRSYRSAYTTAEAIDLLRAESTYYEPALECLKRRFLN